MRQAGNCLALALVGFILMGSLSLAQDKAPNKPLPDRPDQSPSYTPPPAWKSVEIADFYMRRKEYRGALSRYQEAVTTDPAYPRGYLGLGKVYEKLHMPRKALAAYQKYLDLLPSAKEAEEAKDVHRAMEKLQRELKRSPSPAARHAPASSLKSPSS